jgi:aminoglycoside/choline kinase family phosphotransferase
MPWLYLLLAAACEMSWPLGFKITNGFKSNYPAVAGTVVVMLLSFWFLSMATTRGIPIGTAYAVWTGLGAAGTTLLGMTLSGSQRAVLDAAFRQLVDRALGQPQVYVHRDFHSRNLMVSQPNPGILDFQGAVQGPISYDLVSLLRDAYIEWSEEQQLDWAVRYWERAREASLPVNDDFADFWRDFEWMGVQRHLKIAGIFARLAHRDGKPGYLADLPLVMRYLRRACDRYRALGPLLQLLDELEARQPVVGYTF